MQFVRFTLYDVFLVLWTLLLAPVVPVLALLGGPERYVRKLSRVWVGGFILGLKYIANLTHQEKGRENIPDGPCLFVANHQSQWETIVAAVLVPDIAIVAKAELSRIPAFGWCLKHSPMIMVDRDGGAASLRRMVFDAQAAVASGRSILIFPEGTRKSVQAPVEFKPGFELLYQKLGIPVVPVAVNSGVFWGPNQLCRYNGTITISFLPPVPPGLAKIKMKEIIIPAIQHEKDLLKAEAASDEWISAVG